MLSKAVPSLWKRLLLLTILSTTTISHTRAECTRTPSGNKYPFIIAHLNSNSDDFSRQKIVMQTMQWTGQVSECFKKPHYVNFMVHSTFNLTNYGWTHIETGINNAMWNQGAKWGSIPNLVIGPFYTNVAMMLQYMDIPYLVTEYKGFDWIDMSRVQDTVNWNTVIEIVPPAHSFNQAYVDLFISREWTSAMLIMPESAVDNQECQDLASQMLSNRVSLIPFTLNPRGNNVEDKLRDILRSSKIFGMKQILVCSPRDQRDRLIENMLVEARPFGMLVDKEMSFIFVDPTSTLTAFAGAAQMYRLGLFSATCELLAFRYVKPFEDGRELAESEAAAMDAARTTFWGLYTYITEQRRVEQDFSVNRFMSSLKSVTFSGETGYIAFDSNGRRIDYTFYLYNHGGENMYQRLAEWRPNSTTPALRLNVTAGQGDIQTLQQMGIFPEVVKIVIVEERPFVMPINISGQIKYEGFTIDLIKRLSHVLKFDYEIYKSPGNMYGGLMSDGSWDGMVGEIIAGNATLACGSISITSSRESVIDFSLGVISTGVNILVKKPKESFNIFQFMMPFSLDLWMAILGATATISLSFFIMDYFRKDRRFTVRETIWFTIGTLLKRGTDFAPVPVSQRILTVGFTFFVLITVSTYTANMAAFLTTKNFGDFVDSFDALADSKTVSVTTVKNSATSGFFSRGSKPLYRRLWNQMQKHGLSSGANDGIRRVREKDAAFIFDLLINEAAQNIYCDTMAVGLPILLQEHGIGMAAGAPFKSNINIALLKLKEEGFMAKLKKKWWDDKRKCDLGSDNQRSGKVQFGLTHTAGVFIVSLFGVCVAAFLFISKKIWFAIMTAIHKRKQRKKHLRNENHVTAKGQARNRERQSLFDGDRGEAV